EHTAESDGDVGCGPKDLAARREAGENHGPAIERIAVERVLLAAEVAEKGGVLGVEVVIDAAQVLRAAHLERSVPLIDAGVEAVADAEGIRRRIAAEHAFHGGIEPDLRGVVSEDVEAGDAV